MLKQIALDPKALATSPTASPMPALRSDQSPPEYATRKAGQLMNLYRKGDAQDPATYVAGVAAVLSEYPVEIVDYVCDPRTGIARKLKWLPTIAEIVEFCDEQKRRAGIVADLRRYGDQHRATVSDPHATESAKTRAQEWLDRTGGKY